MVDVKKERSGPLVEDFLYDEDEDTQKDKYLSFRVGNEDYAVEIKHVNEIVIMNMEITRVPDMEEYFRGIINLRGKVIPIIDIRMRFGMSETTRDEKTCIVVVNINDVLTGFIVERVSEVIDIPENQIVPPPTVGKKDANRFVKAMGKVGEKVKIILDVNRLLSDGEVEAMKEIQQNG